MRQYDIGFDLTINCFILVICCSVLLPLHITCLQHATDCYFVIKIIECKQLHAVWYLSTEIRLLSFLNAFFQCVSSSEGVWIKVLMGLIVNLKCLKTLKGLF